MLETQDVSKWFGDVIAVNDVTVSVPSGITGFLGPNGAGKSTFMQMAMGLLKPSAGSITVLGEDPWNNPGLLGRIGYVPEGDAPWRDRSGRESVLLAARLNGMTGDAATEAADDALRAVKLTDAQDRRVDAYSKGMRQRLKFAIALLNDPDLLILDEPLVGTDPPTRRDLLEIIKDFETRGKSVLVSTHVLHDVEVMTERILLLNHGRVMAHGEVGEIRDLLDRYPRTVRVATSVPRDLGHDLWRMPSVLSIQAEEGALLVKTREPQLFYAELQAYLLDGKYPFTSVTSPDDNVEAVFRYLVGGA